MEQDMQVVKQVTEEDSDKTKPTKYKVILRHVSMASAKSLSNARLIKKLTIVSEDDSLFKDFGHNEMVSVKVSKPQRKLVQEG